MQDVDRCMPDNTYFRQQQTHAMMGSFFVAMALHPDVQRKARVELDRVVGPTRLPEQADRAHLLYVDAVVKEAFRWHVVAPLSFAHATSSDDEYNGYFIPEKSIVMVNLWYVGARIPMVYWLISMNDTKPHGFDCRAISRDPKMYPDPEKFEPER